MMKKILLLPIFLALFACSNHGGVDSVTKAPAPDTAALVQRVNEIYTETFKNYDGADWLNAAATADSLFCSRDWKDWTARVEQADSAVKAEGMIGFFNADYWIMGQDWQDLSVSDVIVKTMTDSTATVTLKLHNCGSVTDVCLEMVQDEGDWKIDNFIDITHGLDWKANMKEYLTENQ